MATGMRRYKYKQILRIKMTVYQYTETHTLLLYHISLMLANAVFRFQIILKSVCFGILINIHFYSDFGGVVCIYYLRIPVEDEVKIK